MLLAFFQLGRAQQYVLNGDFERLTQCPTLPGHLDRAIEWFSPNGGTPDLFCSCAAGTLLDPAANFAGKEQPVSGKCYAGFYAKAPEKEYLCTALKWPLEKDTLYYLEFFYSRADFRSKALRQIGVQFSAGEPGGTNYKPYAKMSGSIAETGGNDGWTKARLIYKGGGGERFMTIGSFDNGFRTVAAMPAQGDQSHAYYFIDLVSLQVVRDTSGMHCALAGTAPGSPAKFEPQKVFILPQLTFKTASSIIETTSYGELDALAAYLVREKSRILVISGHTDNQGAENNNLTLSRDRANAVADYLSLKGVARARIRAGGFGSSRPVASNNDETGRAKNRRVEFIVK